MNPRPVDLPVPAAPASGEGSQAPAHEPAALPGELPADVARLFRRSLAAGRIHPLMPLLLRYRREQGL